VSEDLYAALGANRDDDTDVLRAAHRKAAKAHHPDVGGKQDDFERIQRAWLVLRDPDKRHRYDTTGTVDDQPNNDEAEIMQMMIQAYDQAVEMVEHGGDFACVIQAAAKMLIDNRAQRLLAVAQTKAEIAKHEKRLSRITFKGDGLDIIGNSIRTKIDECKRSIAQLEDIAAKMDKANIRLIDYEWACGQPAIVNPAFSTTRPWTMPTNFTF